MDAFTPQPKESLWRKEADAMLRELFDKGLSFSLIASAIAKAFGVNVTRNMAIGRAHRLHFPRHPNATIIRKPRAEPRKQGNDGGLALKMQTKTHILSPAPIVRTTAKPAAFLSVRLYDLEAYHCRFPHGGDNGSPITFCGQPRQDGSPYCAAHCDIAYTRRP